MRRGMFGGARWVTAVRVRELVKWLGKFVSVTFLMASSSPP